MSEAEGTPQESAESVETPEETQIDTISRFYDEAEADEPEAIEVSQEESVEEVVQEPVEPVVSELAPPEHWPEDHKQLFASQPEDVRQFILDRHKAMEGDYTRKTQELAEQRKQQEEYLQFAQAAQQAIQPLAQQLAGRGMHPVQALQQASYYLSEYYRDPEGTIRKMAENARLEHLIQQREDAEEDLVDPEVKSLKQELQRIQERQAYAEQQRQQEYQQQLQYAQQQQQEQLYSELQGEIETFSKDHPHMQNEPIRVAVGHKLATAADQGIELSLEDAYNQVVSGLNLQPPQSQEQLKAERVRKAKLAASGADVHGNPDLSKMGQKETLSALFDQLNA